MSASSQPLSGFFPQAGKDYSSGVEPQIATRLDALGKALGIHLVGISGARTPAHSVAVGGFADDPHTRGQASDTGGIETIPEATLEQFGLTRPFAGAQEANHIQLLGGTGVPVVKGAKKAGGGFDPLKIAGNVLSAVGQDFLPHKTDPKSDPFGTGTGDVQTALAQGAGDAASAAGGALVDSLASSFGIHASRIGLYIALVAGGLVLAVLGLSRTAGVTRGDVKAGAKLAAVAAA